MTDSEAAAETVRKFFDAWLAKDYGTMGTLLGGLPEEKIEGMFGKVEVKKIISIGEPVLNPNRSIGGYHVPAQVEFDKDGQAAVKSFDHIGVRPVNNDDQKDRWNIHGGI